ncbi:uncharacterized protein LOC127001408 [Eriocheir sinensis]|uniref:uncharacterized protein LOC127001408 n=1 Tax=Eriocheir sinensis TaxID=95602 RepID=UPI0021CA2BB2|nr:uncharacterized protein LOC127001408 [Eriocheir sinensis]
MEAPLMELLNSMDEDENSSAKIELPPYYDALLEEGDARRRRDDSISEDSDEELGNPYLVLDNMMGQMYEGVKEKMILLMAFLSKAMVVLVALMVLIQILSLLFNFAFDDDFEDEEKVF